MSIAPSLAEFEEFKERKRVEELQDKIQQLLRREATLSDRLGLCQRRLLARRDPVAFLTTLVNDINFYEKFANELFDTIKLTMCALLVQCCFRFGGRPTWSDEENKKFHGLKSDARRTLRINLAMLARYRADTLGAAVEVFEQIAPALHKREKNLRKRLVAVRNDTMGKRTPGGKAQMISACKELQDEVISIDTTIHALEERMLKIIGMSKG